MHILNIAQVSSIASLGIVLQSIIAVAVAVADAFLHVLFKLYASLLEGSINGFLILREEEGLRGNIKYIAMAANAVLLSVKSSFYFRILKLYRESFNKLIVASVIIADIIPNLIKYLVVLEDLPENLYLLVASVSAR